MRFINGWFRFAKGQGDVFMAVMRPMLPRINQMPGVFYLELAQRDGDPDVIVVVEAFVNDAAHAAMWATDEFKLVQRTLDELAPSNLFDNHHADFVLTTTMGSDSAGRWLGEAAAAAAGRPSGLRGWSWPHPGARLRDRG